LFKGTKKDNAQDRNEKGRNASRVGEHNGRAILSWDEVRSIRRRVAAGERQVDVARQAGLSKERVHSIVSGKTWKE
jgi:hypothetical protein